MEREMTTIKTQRVKDNPGPQRPEPLDVLAALEIVLDPNATTAAKADVLKQVREARERAARDRPART